MALMTSSGVNVEGKRWVGASDTYENTDEWSGTQAMARLAAHVETVFLASFGTTPPIDHRTVISTYKPTMVHLMLRDEVPAIDPSLTTEGETDG